MLRSERGNISFVVILVIVLGVSVFMIGNLMLSNKADLAKEIENETKVRYQLDSVAEISWFVIQNYFEHKRAGTNENEKVVVKEDVQAIADEINNMTLNLVGTDTKTTVSMLSNEDISSYCSIQYDSLGNFDYFSCDQKEIDFEFEIQTQINNNHNVITYTTENVKLQTVEERVTFDFDELVLKRKM